MIWMYNFILETYNGFCLSCWTLHLDLEYSKFEVQTEPLFFFFNMFIGVQLLYNGVLVSAL